MLKIIHVIKNSHALSSNQVVSNLAFMYCTPENVTVIQVCGMWLQTHSTVPVYMMWMWMATFHNKTSRTV